MWSVFAAECAHMFMAAVVVLTESWTPSSATCAASGIPCCWLGIVEFAVAPSCSSTIPPSLTSEALGWSVRVWRTDRSFVVVIATTSWTYKHSAFLFFFVHTTHCVSCSPLLRRCVPYLVSLFAPLWCLLFVLSLLLLLGSCRS